MVACCRNEFQWAALQELASLLPAYQARSVPMTGLSCNSRADRNEECAMHAFIQCLRMYHASMVVQMHETSDLYALSLCIKNQEMLQI
jgi:hypothetical protein